MSNKLSSSPNTDVQVCVEITKALLYQYLLTPYCSELTTLNNFLFLIRLACHLLVILPACLGQALRRRLQIYHTSPRTGPTANRLTHYGYFIRATAPLLCRIFSTACFHLLRLSIFEFKQFLIVLVLSIKCIFRNQCCDLDISVL